MEDRFWMGTPPPQDDFGAQIGDEFIDGASKMGPWAFFTPESWKLYGRGRLGTGFGQRYQKQADGRWKKVEG
jgi:hypothetical protein